jgi:hypothetical protein
LRRSTRGGVRAMRAAGKSFRLAAGSSRTSLKFVPHPRSNRIAQRH